MVLTRSRSKSRRVDQSEDDCDTESEMKKEAETDKLPKKVTPTKKTSVPKLKGKARRTANQEQTAETSVVIVEEPLDMPTPTASQKSTKKNNKTPAKKKSVRRQTEELQYLSTEEDAFLSADEDHTDKVKKQRSRSISRTVAQVLPVGKVEAQVPSEDKTGNVSVSQTVNGTVENTTVEAAVTSPAVSTKRTRSGSVKGSGDSDLPEAKKKRRSSRKEAVVVVHVEPLPAPPVPDSGTEVKKRRSSRNVVAEPMPVPDSETAPIASISSTADVVASEVVTVDSGINRQSGVPAPSSSGRGALQKKGKKDKDTWLHNIRGGRIGKPKKLPVGERFKAQHAALLQQGENLYERSERIKQRHEEMNKSAGAVFQRLATPKKQVPESRVVKTNATATGRVAQGTSAAVVATLDLGGDDDASENDPPAQEISNGRKPVATAKPPAKETRIPRPKANAPATNALRQKDASQKQALRSRPVTPTLTLTQPDDTSLIERLSTPKSALKPKEGLISARRGFTKKTGKLSYVDTRKLTDALYMFGIDKGILVKKALQTQFDQAVYDREVKQASKREVQMMEAIRKTIQA